MKFIADGMLGKLARWLRLAGYDTLYFNIPNKIFLIRKAKEENRIILTRDTKFFSQNKEITVFIENEDFLNQLKEVKNKLNLDFNENKFFIRCSLCNIILGKKEKEEIKSLVPEYVFQTHEKFSQCSVCKRVYWEGDHWKKIKEVFSKI